MYCRRRTLAGTCSENNGGSAGDGIAAREYMTQ
jgi:hypothetical protein